MDRSTEFKSISAYGNGTKCLFIYVHKWCGDDYVDQVSRRTGWRQSAPNHWQHDSIFMPSHAHSKSNQKGCMQLILPMSLPFHSVLLKASPSTSIVLLLHPRLSYSYSNHPLWFASGISFDMSFVLISQKSPLPVPTLSIHFSISTLSIFFSAYFSWMSFHGYGMSTRLWIGLDQ